MKEDWGQRRVDRSTFLEKEGWGERRSWGKFGRRGGDSNREWTHTHKHNYETPERFIPHKKYSAKTHSVCWESGISEMRRGTSQARK